MIQLPQSKTYPPPKRQFQKRATANHVSPTFNSIKSEAYLEPISIAKEENIYIYKVIYIYEK